MRFATILAAVIVGIGFSLSSATAATETTQVVVAELGSYLDTSVAGEDPTAIVLPSNDATPGTVMQAAWHASRTPPATGVAELGRFVLSVNHAVTFNGAPTFKVSIAKTLLNPPYVVELREPSGGVIANYVPYWYRDLTFYGGYDQRVHLEPGRRYEAVLLGRAHESSVAPLSEARAAVKLGRAADIDGRLELGETKLPTGWMYSYVGTTVPVGAATIPVTDATRMVYDATLVVGGLRRYTAAPGLYLHVPSALAKEHLAITTFDAARATQGWSSPLPLIPQADGSAQLSLPAFADAFQFRRLDIAVLASSSGPPRLRRPDTVHRPTVAIVGDSLGRLTILAPSPLGCPLGFGALPDCQYVSDPALNYPGDLERLSGYRVLNLSWLGCEAVTDAPSGPSILALEVPQIPADADVVVLQLGHIDLDTSKQDPATATRVDALVRAVRARARSAHLLFLIDRYLVPNHQGSDAWAARERALAGPRDAVVDLRPLYPDTMNAAFPDGGHPTPATAFAIASLLSEALAQWR